MTKLKEFREFREKMNERMGVANNLNINALVRESFLAPFLFLASMILSGCAAGHSNRIVLVHEPSDAGAIVLARDGDTLDFSGKELAAEIADRPPDQFTGRGIVVSSAKNVTIRNAKIRGFKVAIYAENAPGLKIESCDVSNNYRQRLKSTPQKEDESDWLYGHENDNNEWLRYGAGIYLYKCDGATVKNCRARDGQNGICLVNCDNAAIVGNDMSFMSGWGLAMWRSCKCKVVGNRFDYCIRGYSHGVYARGQDSAGILVYEQCSDNVFAYNHATHGGDGFFLYAGNETVNKTGEGGCNRNIVYMNDFSHAVANGIEATFSDQNVFMNNKLTNCEHGIWAGYSSNSLIENNDISDCKNGVSIEHGRRNRSFWNRFTNCARGIWLWWDEDKDLLASPYAKKHGGASRAEYIERNAFSGCRTAIHAQETKELTVNGSTFEECIDALHLIGSTTIYRMIGNIFEGGSLRNETSSPLQGHRNFVSSRVSITGPSQLQMAAADRKEAWRAIHHGPELEVNDPRKPWPWSRAEEMRIPVTAHGPPNRLGTEPLKPLPDIPEGKEHVVIDEWGPKIVTAR